MLRRFSTSPAAFLILVALAAALTVTTLQVVFLRAPIEAQMGIIQKVFYFHVPAAYAMYLGAAACLAGSVAYLLKATDERDALAKAGADVAVMFGTVVLVTGPLWAAKAWGQYWTWDPRLTTTLLSFLVYVAYVLLRSFGGGGEAERRFAAALGFLGAINLPIIHFSVRKWSGQHPQVITGKGGGLQHPDMKLAFALGMVTFTLLAVVFIWSRMRLLLAESKLRRVEREAVELGVGEEA